MTVNRENAGKIRAGVISSALDVEDAITIVLGHWYGSPKHPQEMVTTRLMEDVLAELDFAKKIKLLNGFVKDFPEEFPADMNKNLNEIRETRNQLAHRIFLDPNDIYEFESDGPPKDGKFYFDKIGKTTYPFSLADLEKYQERCHELKLSILFAAAKVSIRLNQPKITKF